MLILIINLFLWLPGLCFSFYKDTSVYGKNLTVSGSGSVVAEYSIIKGEFKAVSNGYLYGCDTFSVYPYYLCDLYVYFTMVIYGDYRPQNKVPITYYRGIIKIWTDYPESRDLTGELGAVNIDAKRNLYYNGRDNNYLWTPTYTFRSSNYLKNILHCAYVEDIEAVGSATFLLSYCLSLYVNTKNFEIQRYHSRAYSTSWALSKLKIFCDNNFYQLSCWLKCAPTHNKFSCNPDGSQRCLTFWQAVRYVYTYELPSFMFKSWYTESVEIWKCTFYNKCLWVMPGDKPLCTNPDEVCYPLGNSSYTCLIFHPIYLLSSYLANNSDHNLTTTSLINKEYVIIHLSLSGREVNQFINRSFCMWKILRNKNDPGMYIDIASDPTMMQTHEDIKYGRYYFEIICEIGLFRTYIFFRDFVIYVMPKELSLRNLTLSNGLFVYLGQTIECYGNSIPLNISEFILNLMTTNFVVQSKRRFENKLDIPIFASVGYCVLDCKFRFLFPDKRPPESILQSWGLNIKSYVDFYWYKKYKNAYLFTDFAGCNYLAYFVGIISVNVLHGKSTLNPIPGTNFSTKVENGGSYLLLCTLRIQIAKIFFYRAHSFDIFNFPTFACLLISYPNPGSFLRCGCNGYPPDQATYVSEITKNNIKISMSSDYALKIPYNIKYGQFLYTCTVKFFINEDSKTFKFRDIIELGDESTKLSTFTDDDYRCSRFIDYNIENVVQISGELLFYLHSFVLFSSDSYYTEFYFLLFTFILTFFSVLRFILYLDSEPTRLFNNVHLRRRVINDKLFSLAKIGIDGHLVHFYDFDEKLLGYSSEVASSLFVTKNYKQHGDEFVIL